MKKIPYLAVLMGLVFLFSCNSNHDTSVRGHAVKAVDVQQQKNVSNKSSTPPGRRSAEEMVAAGFKRYGTEKGTLIFRLDGSVKGTEHIYFDHWGWREGKYINTLAEVGGYKKATNAIQYLDGERRYEYDPATQVANFFESRQVQQSADRYGTKDMVFVGDEMIRRMGGERAGNSTVQGVICEVWEIEKYKTTLHMWEGLTLKERSEMGDMPVGRTCILLDTISEIPLEKMLLPNGVKEVKVSGN